MAKKRVRKVPADGTWSTGTAARKRVRRRVATEPTTAPTTTAPAASGTGPSSGGPRSRRRKAARGTGDASASGSVTEAGATAGSSRKRVRRRVPQTATTTAPTDRSASASATDGEGSTRRRNRVRRRDTAMTASEDDRYTTGSSSGGARRRVRKRVSTTPVTEEPSASAGASSNGRKRRKRVGKAGSEVSEPSASTGAGTSTAGVKRRKRVRKSSSAGEPSEPSGTGIATAATAGTAGTAGTSGTRRRTKVRTVNVAEIETADVSCDTASAPTPNGKQTRKRVRKAVAANGSKASVAKGARASKAKATVSDSDDSPASASCSAAPSSNRAAKYSDSEDSAVFGFNGSLRAGEGDQSVSSSDKPSSSDDEPQPKPAKAKAKRKPAKVAKAASKPVKQPKPVKAKAKAKAKQGKARKAAKRLPSASASSSSSSSSPFVPTNARQIAPNVYLVPMNDTGASYLSGGVTSSAGCSAAGASAGGYTSSAFSSGSSTRLRARPARGAAGYDDYEALVTELNTLASQMGTFGAELSRRRSHKHKHKHTRQHSHKRAKGGREAAKSRGTTSDTSAGSSSSSSSSAAAAATATAATGKSKHVRSFAGKCAVLVTDMSGFTRLTRRHGILHYASLIVAMRELLAPMFRALDATAIETEADDFFVVFTDVASAVRAAALVREITAAYNEGKEPDYQIQIGGMGIGFGTGLVQDKLTGAFHGPPFARAFRLGENLAEDGEILIDLQGKRAFEQSGKVSGVSFDARELDGDEADGLVDEHFAVSGTPRPRGKYATDSGLAVPAKPSKNASDAECFTAQALRRLALPKERKAVDKALAERFFVDLTVVMMGIDFGRLDSAAESLALEQRLFIRNRRIVESHGGDARKGSLWVFPKAESAVRATLEIKAAIEADEAEIPLLGFGVHAGRLLSVTGTNVLWGDPINTASKLGEDVATGGEIFITDVVRDAIAGSDLESALMFAKRELVISKVEIDCFKIRYKKGAKPKKGTAKKGSAKKGTAKKGSAKKGTAKKGTAKKGSAKKGSAKKGSAKKVSKKKAGSKK